MTFTRSFGLVMAALFVLGQTGFVRAQSDETARVVPDAYFVQHECDRLLAMTAGSFEIAQAQTTIRTACAAYAVDHDGDRWFAAGNAARKTLDSYETDHTQHAFKLVTPRVLVPRGAKVYVVFLAPSSSAWAASDLPDLRSKFEDFGGAIGAENLAIWFDQNGNPYRLDTARCRYYFDLFRLAARGMRPEGGPYIVTTSTRPDLWSSANDVVAIDLGGASVARATDILSRLGTDLRRLTAGQAPNFLRLASQYKTVIEKNPAAYRAVNTELMHGT